MAIPQRQMRLAEHHVRSVQPNGPMAGIPNPPAGLRASTAEEYTAPIDGLLATGPDDVWVFAYGSLIWKPAFEFVEKRQGLVHGWHRDFCLGWDNSFRGSDENPALMLALDRGGSCNGMLYRLPPDRVGPALTKGDGVAAISLSAALGFGQHRERDGSRSHFLHRSTIQLLCGWLVDRTGCRRPGKSGGGMGIDGRIPAGNRAPP